MRMGARCYGAALAAAGLCAVLMVTVASAGNRAPAGAAQAAIRFTDARSQAAEFIAYDRAITLDPAQKKVMDEALRAIPAPCCDAYSIATCCCPCNLAKSVWGLSKFLIARQNFNAAEVKDTVGRWLAFTNPGGYSGDACFTQGCERPFDRNGCGGMDVGRIR